jgi:hypothetical protein
MNCILKLSIIVIFLLVCINSSSAHTPLKRNSPILILGDAGHFDEYTGEILKAEGFNAFQIHSLRSGSLSPRFLKQFDIVILTNSVVSSLEKTVLESYVKNGGNLIAFRPDAQLAALFGLGNKMDSLRGGYIAISTNTPIGTGLLPVAMQFHGEADLYSNNAGTSIASFDKTVTSSQSFPAVIKNDFGRGHAIAFLYNLPKSIAYTRQGNPKNAGIEKDGIKGIRAMDLFTDGWVDTSRNTINQADEQMRLLSHCIENLNLFTKPLPRLWYFPDTLRSLITLTNDGEYRAEADFVPQFTDIESKGANMALYILSTDKVSKTATDLWQQRGNEISGHPDDTEEAEHPTWQGMNKAIDTKLNEIDKRFNISSMHTIVNHWFVWCGNNAAGVQDFTAQAKIEAAHGIGMDINYAHYDNNAAQPRFLGSTGYSQGNYSGSGLPMKFASAEGQVIDIYQHFNNVYDQQYMENQDAIGFYNCFKGLLDRSIYSEVYSYISIKAHNDEYFFSKTPLLNMLDYAAQLNIPVITPLELLNFLKAKDEASFTNIRWSRKKNLSFTLRTSLIDKRKISFMVPLQYQSRKIAAIKTNGAEQVFVIRKIKGFEYALVSIQPGRDVDVVVRYEE